MYIWTLELLPHPICDAYVYLRAYYWAFMGPKGIKSGERILREQSQHHSMEANRKLLANPWLQIASSL